MSVICDVEHAFSVQVSLYFEEKFISMRLNSRSTADECLLFSFLTCYEVHGISDPNAFVAYIYLRICVLKLFIEESFW